MIKFKLVIFVCCASLIISSSYGGRGGGGRSGGGWSGGGGRSFGGFSSRSSLSSKSSPSYSSYKTSSYSSSIPSRPSPSYRTSNPPSYGWNIPKNIPSREIPSYHTSNPQPYGWNIPKSIPSRSSPSFHTSNSPSYDLNTIPSGSSSSHHTSNSPSYGLNIPSGSSSFLPIYSWNMPLIPVQINSGTKGPIGPPVGNHATPDPPTPPVIKEVVKYPAPIDVAPSLPAGPPLPSNSLGGHRHITTDIGYRTPSVSVTQGPVTNDPVLTIKKFRHFYGPNSDLLNSLPPFPKVTYSPSPSPSPSYTYTASDVGSGALGLFLRNSLGNIIIPTNDGSRPRYDHYEVHHYYHNKEAASVAKELPSNTIVQCVGNSSTICPKGTTSLCTSNGTIMCVTAASATTPCTENQQINCVKTVLPCINATDCGDQRNNQTTVSLPCISNTKIEGDIMVVNNTIIISSSTTTEATTTTITSTTTQVPSTENIKAVKTKREVSTQNFCITIVAVPTAPRKNEVDFNDIIDKVCNDMKRIKIYSVFNSGCPLRTEFQKLNPYGYY